MIYSKIIRKILGQLLWWRIRKEHVKWLHSRIIEIHPDRDFTNRTIRAVSSTTSRYAGKKVRASNLILKFHNFLVQFKLNSIFS